MRLIDADSFYDNLMDIYGDKNSLVFLGDVLDLIDQQPIVNISVPITQRFENKEKGK